MDCKVVTELIIPKRELGWRFFKERGPGGQPPKSQALSTAKRQKASDLRKHCARGGTRTTFLALQTLGTPENIGNPSNSDRCTTQSEAESVDTVNTPFFTSPELLAAPIFDSMGRPHFCCGDVLMFISAERRSCGLRNHHNVERYAAPALTKQEAGSGTSPTTDGGQQCSTNCIRNWRPGHTETGHQFSIYLPGLLQSHAEEVLARHKLTG
jgi:hypothetical protein